MVQKSAYSFCICISWWVSHPWYPHGRPCSKTTRCEKKNGRIIWLRLSIRHFGNFTHRLTSSALCAIKNPCVFACILAPRGLMDILLSAPSSAPLISMANNSNFSLEKHSLNATNSEMWERRRQKGNIWITPVLYGAF